MKKSELRNIIKEELKKLNEVSLRKGMLISMKIDKKFEVLYKIIDMNHISTGYVPAGKVILLQCVKSNHPSVKKGDTIEQNRSNLKVLISMGLAEII